MILRNSVSSKRLDPLALMSLLLTTPNLILDILNADTPIIVVDPNPSPQQQRKHLSAAQTYPVRGYGDALFRDLHDAQRIDFGFLEARYKGKSLDDPLPDSFFEPSHKKAERLERSIRNSEKGRAQHEKDQIVRLLEGLQGHDWLRVMGVSGITESRKKTFEPAREYFIKGCQSILEKFRTWAAEEKRRKLEKERAIAEAEAEAQEDEVEEEEAESKDDEEEEEEEEAEEEDEDEEEEEEEEETAAVDEQSNEDVGDAESDGDPPDLSDVDASIAKQLREEALAAARTSSKTARSAVPVPVLAPPAEPEQLKEFTSFFQKRYQRDAALSKSRRRGRTVVAWGHLIPEATESEFVLPKDFLDEATLRSQARRRRRDKRGKP
jgi:hypothetical protein